MTTLQVVILIAFVIGLGVLGMLAWWKINPVPKSDPDQDPIRMWVIDTVFRTGIPLSGHWEPNENGPRFTVQALMKLTPEQKDDLLNRVEELRKRGVDVTLETLDE